MHREVYGGTAGRSRSPLIGRRSELERLDRARANAFEGDGTVLLLWGGAGVGKTRLFEEFSAMPGIAGAAFGTAACFEGLCPPFAPLAQAFACAGLGEVLDSFGDLRSLGAEAAKHRFFLAIAGALRERDEPVVLIFDDLHWADFATLEFLAFLTPLLSGMRVLVLGAVRSESLERDHARYEALTTLRRLGAHRLDVGPLRDEDIRRLVTTIWPAAATASAPAHLERICTLAEGRPYFAEELVAGAAGTPQSSIAAPPLSIRAGVLVRFERLEAQERRILLCASVIGRSFSPALLQTLSGVPDDAVSEALRRAHDLQLVGEPEARSGDFEFRHAITREILYREMLSVEAQKLHRELARILSAEDREDTAGDLAYHCDAAGDRELAGTAYERAGDRAMERYAHRDAEKAYRRALEVREDGASGLAALREKFSRALSINGALSEARVQAQAAADAYAKGGEREKAAGLTVRLARRHYEAGNAGEARAAAQCALELSDARGPVAFDALTTLAHFEALQSRPEAAAEYLLRAEATPGERTTTSRRDFHLVRAIVKAATVKLGSAFEDYEEAVRIARQQGDPEQLSWTLNNYASRALATGRTAAAIDAYREAVANARAADFGKSGALAASGLALAYLFAGELEAARVANERVSEVAGAHALAKTTADAVTLRLAYLRGDDAFDSDASAIAVALAFESGETQNIGLIAAAAATAYETAERYEEAASLRSRALAAIGSIDLSLWLIDRIAAVSGEPERACARTKLARAAVDDAHLAARAYLALFDARVAKRGRNVAAVRALAAEAERGFAAIGWPWERAQALELAGRHAQALAIYERHGYVRHHHELERARRRGRHRAAANRLTQREREVAALAAAGKTNRAIATALFISERTVETHIAAIFDRFDLSSRTELASLLEALP